jgi:hypothetical protein
MEDSGMANELLPDGLWLRIVPLIPPEAPKPKGGRPPCVGPGGTHSLTGILFVLKTRIPQKYSPDQMGCRSGVTGGRRLWDWYKAGV